MKRTLPSRSYLLLWYAYAVHHAPIKYSYTLALYPADWAAPAAGAAGTASPGSFSSSLPSCRLSLPRDAIFLVSGPSDCPILPPLAPLRLAMPIRCARAGFRSPPPLLLMPAAAGPPPLPRECCRTLRPPRSGVGVSYLAPWSSARRRTALSSSPQLVHTARPPIVHTARPPSQCATDLDRTLAAAASLPLLQTYPAAMMPIPRFPPIHCATDFGCTLAAAASLPPHQTYPAAMMPFPRSPPIQ